MKIERIAVILVGATLGCSGGGDDGLERVVLTSEVGSYSGPAYSPDGTRLAFVRSHEGEQTIWTTAPDGSDASPLTEPARNQGDLDWAPDSRTIAYVDDSEGFADLWTVSTTTREATRITDGRASMQPQFSSDGSRILFGSFVEGTVNTWIMPAVGGKADPVVGDPNADVPARECRFESCLRHH